MYKTEFNKKLSYCCNKLYCAQSAKCKQIIKMNIKECELNNYLDTTTKHKSDNIALNLCKKCFTRMTDLGDGVFHDRKNIVQYQPISSLHVYTHPQYTSFYRKCPSLSYIGMWQLLTALQSLDTAVHSHNYKSI